MTEIFRKNSHFRKALKYKSRVRKSKDTAKFIASIFLIVFISLVSTFVFSIIYKPQKALAVGPDNTVYRRTLTITNSGSTLTDFQVSFTFDTTSQISGSRMRSDCGDIRFTDTDDTTQLNYWIEPNANGSCNGANTRIWVRIPSLTSGSKVFYMYYGNPSATAQSSGTNTFVYFNDFNNLTGFTLTDSGNSNGITTNSFYTGSSELRLNTGAAYSNSNSSTFAGISGPSGYIIESKVRYLEIPGGHSGLQIANTTNTAGSNSTGADLSYILKGSGAISEERFFGMAANTASGGSPGYGLSSNSHSLENPSTNIVPVLSNQTYILGLSVTGSTLASDNMLYFVDRVSRTKASIPNNPGTWNQPFYLWFGNFAGSNSGTTNIADTLIDWTIIRQRSPLESTLTPIVGSEEGYPSAPQNLTGTPDSGQVSLTWDAPSSNGGTAITDYIIEYKETSSGTYNIFSDGTSTSTNTIVTGLNNGTSYDFRVIAVNANGQGTPSSEVTYTPNSATAPIASNLNIRTGLSVGAYAEVFYDYFDAESDTESGTTFQWQRGPSFSGPFTDIPGATQKTYFIKSSDLGTHLNVIVTPRNNVSPTTGDPASSSTGSAILPRQPYFNHIILTGQSLAQGYDGRPALSTTQTNFDSNDLGQYSNMMLDGSSFVPLIENFDPIDTGTGVVETPASGLANTISNLAGEEVSFQSIVTRQALNTATIAQLSQGSATYNANIADVTSVYNEAMVISDSRVLGIAFIQGGGDISAGTSGSAYEEALVQLQSDYNEDIRSIWNQSNINQFGEIPLFIDQASNHTSYNQATSPIHIAQLSAFENNPGRIYMVTPKYFFDYIDYAHLTPESYRWLGEYFGKAMSKVYVDGVDWKPLYPTQITRNGAIINAKFHVPAGNLVFDNSISNDAFIQTGGTNTYGFEYFDDSGTPPAITNVEIIGSDQVRITLASTPSGGNQRLRYAYTGVAQPDTNTASNPGNRPGADQTASIKGNLRDTDPTPSLYGNDLYNWSVEFDKAISPSSDSTPPNSFTPNLSGLNPSNQQTPTLTFSTTDNVAIDRYQVSIDGGPFVTQSSPYQLPTLSEGDHTIIVRAYDTSGNYTDSTTINRTIDITPPNTFTPELSVSSPTSDNTPTLTFSTTDNVAIDYYMVQINGGSYNVQTSPYQLPTLPDGPNTINVRAHDTATNQRVGTVNLVVDTSGPTGLTFEANESSPTNNQTPTLNFSATDTNGIDRYELQIDSGSFSEVTSPYVLPTQTEGEHTYTIRAYDTLDNFTEDSISLTIDITSPDSFTIEPSVSSPTPTQNISITFSTTDNLSNVIYYEVRLNSGSYNSATSPANITLAEGQNTIYVRATDEAGNQTIESIIMEYNPPTTPSPTPSPSPSPTSTPSPTPTECSTRKTKGDTNCDGTVNISDLSILAFNWNTSNITADFNNDGSVNISDLSILAFNWNKTV